jgi:hypothetical protein
VPVFPNDYAPPRRILAAHDAAKLAAAEKAFLAM